MLSFDIRDDTGAILPQQFEVELIGNGHTLFYCNTNQFTTSPASVWTNWVITLAPTATSLWRLDSYNSTNFATASDFMLVLSNLQALKIDMDLAPGQDTVDLDNVRMAPAVAAQIQSPHRAGTNVVFSLSTVNGQSYTVQQNTNLASANWLPCTNFIGNGSVYQFTNPVAGLPRNFYRVTTP